MRHSSRTILDVGQRRWLLGAFGVVAAVILLALLPPFVEEPLRGVLRTAFSPACHQLPSRTFQVEGVPVALCHRCLGIYSSLALVVAALAIVGVLPRLRYGKPVIILGLSLVPIAVDWLGDLTGFWANTPVSRMVTGSVFGVVAGFFLAQAIVDAAATPRAASGGPVE